ncbi:MAG: matrixin family metalloprotease [Bacteroidota bacterium]
MTHRPCSHTQENYTLTSDYLLPFTHNDGIVFWYLNNGSSNLGYEEQEAILKAAFADWNKHIEPLRFERTYEKKKAYIQIWFTGIRRTILAEWITAIFPGMKKYFTIEPFPMDEAVLAYAFGAGDARYPGHLYINDKYDWKSGMYSLCKVVTHEIGHAANIGHSEFEEDIMFENYRDQACITQDTIDAINFKYGHIKTQYSHVVTSQSSNGQIKVG